MNFAFSNLLGAPYRGGTLLIHGSELLTSVGNRVGQINLAQSTSQTLPFENLKQIQTLCLSPDGALLLSIDCDGRALLVNRKRRALLHHFTFKSPVTVAKFSPDGKYIAAGVGRLVQVWKTPGFEKQMSPMQLHRTYGQCHSDIVDLDWSPDSQFIAVASQDIVARVFSLHPIEGYEPPMLSGHKDSLVSIFFTGPATRRSALVAGKPLPVLYTLSRDGALFSWTFTPSNTLQQALGKGRKGQQGKAGAGDGDAASGKGAGKRAAGDGDEEEGQVPGGTTTVLGVGPRPPKRRKAVDGEAAAAEKEAAKEAEAVAKAAGQQEGEEDDDPKIMPFLAGGAWSLAGKDYMNQRGSRISCATFHKPTGVLVTGSSTGLFDIYQLPEFENIQTLSISRERITSVAFNPGGDWIAVGCAKLGQLLVWEWRSESYVLKQQGHVHEINSVAFSPDGALLATGSADRKLKLFQVSSGFCFVTFTDHTAPITAVAFLPSGHALVSASLDGTVRAFDLVRYRNFRTLTSPTPVQFACLAVDPGGEVVAAGTVDSFQVYVWSLKTGRLLDILAGHSGPVCCMAFSPTTQVLATGSWDKTVRIWDVFAGKGNTESFQHTHDVLALAYRPDGKQLAVATLNGEISFWDPNEGVLQHTIEGRRDIRGGRSFSDRRSANNLAAGAAFTSLAYSADGSFIVAGSSSKYVVVYDVADRVMLRRFAVTSNRSLDGVLDQLHSRNLTDAGPLQLIDHEEADKDDAELLPPMLDASADLNVPGAPGKKRALARTSCVSLSPTGRSWAAATTEGVVMYSLDDDMLFDPTDLTEDVTPAACRAALAAGAHVRAALIALRLGDPSLLRACVFATPPAQIQTVAGALPAAFLPQVLTALSEYLTESPHLEFVLRWARALCLTHGPALEAAGVGASGDRGAAAAAAAAGSRGTPALAAAVAPALRALQKALTRVHEDLASACETNLYSLEYLLTAGTAAAAPAQQGGEGNQQGDTQEGVDAGTEEGEEGEGEGVEDDDEESEEQEAVTAAAALTPTVGSEGKAGKKSGRLKGGGASQAAATPAAVTPATRSKQGKKGQQKGTPTAATTPAAAGKQGKAKAGRQQQQQQQQQQQHADSEDGDADGDDQAEAGALPLVALPRRAGSRIAGAGAGSSEDDSDEGDDGSAGEEEGDGLPGWGR